MRYNFKLHSLTIFIWGLFIINSCVNKVPIEFDSYLIDRGAIGIFPLNKSIEELKLPKFYDSKETRKTDEDGEIYSTKKFFLDKDVFIETIFYDNRIVEIATNSDLFATSDGIKVGCSFAETFKKLNNNYTVEDDMGVIMLFDKRNHLRIWFTNSNIDLFTNGEINDLYNNKLTFPKDKLDKMIVKQIDLISFDD